MAQPSRRAACAVIASLFLLAALPAAAQTSEKPYEPQRGQSGKDVIWIPTPDEVVKKMFEMVQLAPGERLVDLGSGDGKIAIAAAKAGAIAKGIEYNPQMVEYSKRMAKEAGVDNVELVQGDIFETDFTNADVVTLYLLPHLNEKLRPTLLAMKPGTRVTSHAFLMGDWEPDQSANVDGRDAYFWRVPVKIDGEWQTRIGNGPGPALRIRQQYQKIEGQVEWGNRAGPLRDAVVRGAVIAFTFSDANGVLHRFEGVSDHNGPLTGVIFPVKGGAHKLFTATRR